MWVFVEILQLQHDRAIRDRALVAPVSGDNIRVDGIQRALVLVASCVSKWTVSVITPRACTRGKVIRRVVVSTKIAISQDVGI